MELPTDRLGLLVNQFTASYDISRDRLQGLTDEEYLWEPVPGCWSIRHRSKAISPKAEGAGDWVMDFERPEPVPAPFTTIAWRLGHLYSSFSLRWDWTFGKKQLRDDDIQFTPSAAEALDRFWALLDRWKESVAALTDEQMDQVGFGQFPRGLDPQLPFICIVWWTNRELIMHLAEISLLRDLWANRGTPALR